MPLDLLRMALTNPVRTPRPAPPPVPRQCEILIVGGGPMALALAEALTRDGDPRRVCVLAPDAIGARAGPRWAVAGIQGDRALGRLGPLPGDVRPASPRGGELAAPSPGDVAVAVTTLAPLLDMNLMLAPRGAWRLLRDERGALPADAEMAARFARQTRFLAPDAVQPDWQSLGLLFDADALTWSYAQQLADRGVCVATRPGLTVPAISDAGSSLSWDGGEITADRLVIADDALAKGVSGDEGQAWSWLRTAPLKPLFDPVLYWEEDDLTVLQAPGGDIQASGPGTFEELCADVAARVPALAALEIRQGDSRLACGRPEGEAWIGGAMPDDPAAERGLRLTGFGAREAAVAPALAPLLARGLQADTLSAVLARFAPVRADEGAGA